MSNNSSEGEETSYILKKEDGFLNIHSSITLTMPQEDENLKKNILYFHTLNKHQKLDKIKNESDIVILPHTSIKFLSYNISLNSSQEKIINQERVNNFIQYMENYDIICLQSISSYLNNSQFEIERGAFRKGFYFLVKSPQISTYSYFMKENGLMILSRFPIDKWAYIPFSSGAYNDYSSENGILYAKLLVGTRYIHVVNILLQSNEFCNKDPDSNYLNNVLSGCYQIRNEQLNEVFDFMKECIFHDNQFKDSDLTLLCGNFNIDKYGYKNFMINKPSFNINPELCQEYEKFISSQQIFQIENIMDSINDNQDNDKIAVCSFGDYDEENDLYEKIITNDFYRKSKMLVDYAFKISMFNRNVDSFIINKESLKYEKFIVSEPPLTNISDHYGLSFEIEYNNDYIQNEENQSNKTESDVPIELMEIV